MATVVIGEHSYELEDLSPEAQALAHRCAAKAAQLQQAQMVLEEQTILRNQYAGMLQRQVEADERENEEPKSVEIIADEGETETEN